jgi:hypothetical protein
MRIPRLTPFAFAAATLLANGFAEPPPTDPPALTPFRTSRVEVSEPVPESDPEDSEAPIADDAPRGSAPSSMDALDVDRLPAYAYGDTPRGLAYSSVFDPNPVHRASQYGRNALSPLRATPLPRDANAGPVEGRYHLDLPHFRAGYGRNTRTPENAHFNVGPLFGAIDSLSASLLFSDNIDRRENDRKSDAISIVALNFTLGLALTSNLQFITSGQIAWLPFEGEFGLGGLRQSLPFLISPPRIDGRLAYDTIIAGWPVIFADEYNLLYAEFYDDDGDRDDLEIFDGFVFDEEDRAGRYAFRPRFDREFDNARTYENTSYLRNRVGAYTHNYLPADTRFEAALYREDFIYLDDGYDSYPDYRHVLELRLLSERENLRFKPFARYRATDIEGRDRLEHRFQAGFSGPVTDQLHLAAHASYYVAPSDNGNNSLLFHLSLRHIAGPYTQHHFLAERATTELSDSIRTEVAYGIRHVLGPRLVAHAHAFKEWFEGIDDDYRYERAGIGGLLTFTYGPRTTFTLSARYTLEEYPSYDSNLLTIRFGANHFFNPNLAGRFYYQFQNRDSSRDDNSYYENLVFLNITQYFR